MILAIAACYAPATAQDRVPIPGLWDLKRKIERPEGPALRTIRFLTENDYPPFHFIGPDGQLTGFEIDLAREICERLGATCSIQSIRWDGLFDALQRGQGDAIIAALRISPENRAKARFTAPYFRSPARFVARSAAAVTDATVATLRARNVAVVARSAHEAYLKAFFPETVRVTVETATAALEAVARGEATAAFVDATVAAFWINGEGSSGCCRFVGGPFIEPRFFGEGAGIAVRPDGEQLQRGLDWALQTLAADGAYARLYLKYFPVGLY